MNFKGTWYTWSPKTLIFYILSDIFIKATMNKKSEWYFFDQGFIDEKSDVKVEKCPPGGKAKIKNVKHVKYAKSDIFIFNFTTRWHF